MDVYLRELYIRIIIDITNRTGIHTPSHKCSDLNTLAQKVKNVDGIEVNFNEDDRLHSQYLGDQYEPAIIIQYDERLIYYYLFDGEIKDCIHPVSIEMGITRKWINYYSSERIKQKLPVKIHTNKYTVYETFNKYGSVPLLAGYKSECLETNIADYPEQDYTLHDCMEPALQFKFAD